MLILSAKKGHGFYIGEDVYVLVKDIRTKDGELEVAVGFEAPKDVRILRKPIMDAIKMEKLLKGRTDEGVSG